MTIKDLAKKTGYGVATVSRALNNHPNVSEKARQVIIKAAQDSGFEMNQNAKQLKQTRMTSVLVIVKGTSNELSLVNAMDYAITMANAKAEGEKQDFL